MDATPADVPIVEREIGAEPSTPRLSLVSTAPAAPARRRAVSDILAFAPWCATAAVVGGSSGGHPSTRLAGAAVGALLAAAAVVDVRDHRLPNRLVGAAFVAALGGAATSGDAAVAAAAVGALLAGGLLLGVYLSRGVGMGDVKAAAAIGMALGQAGWWVAPSAVAVAATTASIYGWARGVRRLPFGPSLVLGWAALVVATRWW
jgi:leader peptidase (prepilin peptidase)/N-methyltransferase